MSEEIIYTSAPRGLKTGSRGFCTVASTPGMASTLAALLESLSGYRHLSNPGDSSNPTVYNHLTTRVGGRDLHILSRIADAGLDYSGRSNKLVHHVVIDPREASPAGPAWVQQQAAFHEQQWQGEPRILPAGRIPAQGDSPPRRCQAWQALMGDAGWAGMLAENVTNADAREKWLIYPLGADVLGLISESIALLPPLLRWQATYSTFFTKLPPGVECKWRFVPDGTDEAATLRKKYDLKVLDLCILQPLNSESQWTEAARTGTHPQFGRRHAQPAAVEELPFAMPTSAVASSESDAFGIELDRISVPGAPPPLPGVSVRVRPRWRGRERNAYDDRGGGWKLAAAATAIVLVGLLGVAYFYRDSLVRLVTNHVDAGKEQTAPQKQGTQTVADPAATLPTSVSEQAFQSASPMPGIPANGGPPDTSTLANENRVEEMPVSINEGDSPPSSPAIYESGESDVDSFESEAAAAKIAGQSNPFVAESVYCELPKVSYAAEHSKPIAILNPGFPTSRLKLSIFTPKYQIPPTFLQLSVKREDESTFEILTSKPQRLITASIEGSELMLSATKLLRNQLAACVEHSALQIEYLEPKDNASHKCVVYFKQPLTLKPIKGHEVPELTHSRNDSLLKVPIRFPEQPPPFNGYTLTIYSKSNTNQPQHEFLDPIAEPWLAVGDHKFGIEVSYTFVPDSEERYIELSPCFTHDNQLKRGASLLRELFSKRDEFAMLAMDIGFKGTVAQAAQITDDKLPQNEMEGKRSKLKLIATELSKYPAEVNAETLRSLLSQLDLDFEISYPVVSDDMTELKVVWVTTRHSE